MDLRAAFPPDVLAAMIALSGIDPADLTPEQRFAIAYAAGCEVETEWKDHRLVVRTKRRIAIEKIDGHFVVRELR